MAPGGFSRPSGALFFSVSRNRASRKPVRPASINPGPQGVPMDSFWHTWRREIIRGAILFGGVIAIGLCVRYIVGRVRAGVVDNLPVALRNLRDLRGLRNLKDNDFQFDHDPGPRDTADTWAYRGKVAPGKWLWIGNTNGAVTVEPAKGDSVEVVAVKTHTHSDPASVHIETT